MPIGIITGSGTHALPGFADAELVLHETPFGTVEVSRGRFAGADVLHVSRHGAGHVRLSHQVTHRADIRALHDLGATAVIGCTACGAVDPSLELGSLVVFDDLHFPSNRLPDGSLCTFFDAPGDPARGHWILHGGPFSEGVRAALLAAAAEPAMPSAMAGPTATSTGRASTRRRRSPSWPPAASTPSARPAGPRRCCAASSSCPSR